MANKKFETLDGINSTGAVNVTNTVTVSANLIVDTDTLFVDTSADSVGVNTTPSSSYALDVAGDIHTSTSVIVGGSPNVTFTHNGTVLNVTGSNVNFDANTLYIDTTNNRVGVNTAPSSNALTVVGDVSATKFWGDGSGLTNISADGVEISGNANTFDNLDSTSFLRSDAQDIHTSGFLIFTSSGPRVNDNIPLSFGTGSDVTIKHDGTDLIITGAVPADSAHVINGFIDEDTMLSNSDALVPTQQSVKAYVDTQILTKDNTDEITEGSTNLYYTDARADARVDAGFTAKSTTNLSEGTNLYYTDARADARIAAADTDDVSEGSTNLYYTDARADARIAAADTDDVSEGSTNLYYTDARVDTHLNQTNPTSGYVLSWNGTDYAWVDNAGYTNSDVDTHLNTSSAASSEVLSWTGTDYDWIPAPSGVAGSDTQVQFNNSGTLAGSSGFVFNSGTNSVTITGDMSAANFNSTSDVRLKDNIETLDGTKVYDMRGVSYTKGGREESGVIAQEMQEIAPELVDNTGEYLTVSYGNLVGYLIEAVKDLKKEVDILKNK